MNEPLTIVFSDCSLFDPRGAAKARLKGSKSLHRYYVTNRNKPLPAGPCLDLATKLSHLKCPVTDTNLVHVAIVSKLPHSLSDRLFNNLEEVGINPGAVSFVSSDLPAFVKAYSPQLFLSQNKSDVREVQAEQIAAAHVYPNVHNTSNNNQIRIAFDGDCVLFSDESERVFTQCPENGLKLFFDYEINNKNKPMSKGPLFALLKSINTIQNLFPPAEKPFRLSLVTARSFPTHSRPLVTFKRWKIDLDDVFFMNGRNKSAILAAFKPHMFFDDQAKHCTSAAHFVPVAQVFNETTKHSNGT